jgi:hypothetical protein
MRLGTATILSAVSWAFLAAAPLAHAGEDAPPAKPEVAASNEADAVLLLFRYAAAQDAHAALKKAFAARLQDLAEEVSEEPAKLDADAEAKLRKLIAGLGASDFDAREKATADIRAFGKAAIPLLAEVKGSSKDAEVVSRAGGLIEDLSPKKRKGPLPWSKVQATFAKAVPGGSELSGYRFVPLVKDSAGKELGSERHALLAVPVEAGKTGTLVLLCCAELKAGQAGWTLWSSDAAGKAPEALPAEPGKEGWRRVDGVLSEPGGLRAASLETNAVGSCRAYAEAQSMFHRNDWDGNGVLEYAAGFTQLYSTQDANRTPIQLIDRAFSLAATPRAPKHGYYFVDMVSIGGTKINPATDFALCAVPAVYGKNGKQTFIINTNGTTFGKDTGGKPVFDYPADPVKAGWKIAE